MPAAVLPRLLIAVVLALPLVLVVVRSAPAAEFVSVIEDLPLMPGLVEVPGDTMEFEGPTGRIVEVLAAGDVSAAAVEAFYAETLPQLGWRLEAPGRYRRDDEILSLAVAPAPEGASGAAVRFRLRPAGR